MMTGAVIDSDILSRTDLPIFVKLVYGRVAVLLEGHDSIVLTAEDLATQCGVAPRQAAKALRYLVSLGLIRFRRSPVDRSIIHVSVVMK